jgi:hypothetical protein
MTCLISAKTYTRTILQITVFWVVTLCRMENLSRQTPYFTFCNSSYENFVLSFIYPVLGGALETYYFSWSPPSVYSEPWFPPFILALKNDPLEDKYSLHHLLTLIGFLRAPVLSLPLPVLVPLLLILNLLFYIYSYSLSISHAIWFLKPSKALNVKISSTSLLYAHYMFQLTFVIFRCI